MRAFASQKGPGKGLPASGFAGYRLYPLTPIDAAFDAGGAPPHWHNVWDESAPRDRDGNLVPEMTSAVADVDVVALHKDLTGSNFT